MVLPGTGDEDISWELEKTSPDYIVISRNLYWRAR